MNVTTSFKFCIQTGLKIAALEMQGLRTRLQRNFKVNVDAFCECMLYIECLLI